ncbi:mediator complex, subunit Med18 [Bombardia bombarda]|uniref:Mediator of RNA polymerase II transcription subunit 18 n=1 Tax=Bombardia bombarda TaxID=252184 RepID=A0AA39TMJ4_9PEZI|nr:mediator complex, subunit Med18 [Bombardia bombarda]
MLNEIFLTAIVADAEAQKARTILAGITEMREQHHITKTRHLRRDLAVSGLPTIRQLQKGPAGPAGQKTPNAAAWQELHSAFLRQSYIIQRRLDITDDVLQPASTGATGPVAPPAAKIPYLRFTDVPDSVNPIDEPHTKRRALEISDRRLDVILAENRFTVFNEYIEESYHWWQNDVEFALTRYYLLPQTPSTGPGNDPAAAPKLSLDIMEPLGDWWFLYARVQVDSKPESLQEGHVKLRHVRHDLRGIFEFKVFDRRVHDTRNLGDKGPA